jgi:nucleotide-binding universal stress UspA family protein
MTEPLRVLLATDGQEAARTAQHLLSRIGDRDRVEVTVLAVASFGIALDEGMRTEGRFSPEAGRRHVREVAATVAGELRADGFRAEDRTAADDPAGRIVDLVAEERHALVVVGAGQPRRLPLLGSVSTRVLHESKASVLVVHAPPREQDTVRALLGTDGSGDALVACRILTAVADPARVEVNVLSVARTGAAAPPAPDVSAGLARAKAEQEAADAAEALAAAGFQVGTEVVDGRAQDALVGRATDGPYDLVAVGARGRRGVRQALLGSVSDSVARFARAALIARDRPEDA